MTLVHHVVPCVGPVQGTLVFLHGLGDSPAGWSFLPAALALPGLEVILVQAPIPYGPGWSWYDFENPRRGRLDIGQSRAALSELLDQLDKVPAKTVLGGFSQGAVMSIDTALRGSLPLAGVLAISGYVPLLEDFPASLSKAGESIPVLATHGPWDNVLPLDMVRPQMEGLRSLGAKLEFETFDKAHDLDLEEELPRIQGWIREKLSLA